MVWANENNDIVVIAFGTVILVLLLIGFVSFYIIYQKILQKKQAHLHTLEINFQKKVMAAIIDTQEIERKRMAEDMHDELGALILALKLSHHELTKNNEDSEKKLARIQHNEEMIESIASRVRKVSHNLLPLRLKKGHFEKSIVALCELMNSSTHIKFDFKREEELLSFQFNDQISLYRIINEWLTNIIKHSNSKTVHLEFYKDGNFIVFSIIDDGGGFNFKQSLQKNKGLGLMSIDGRLKQMNAEYSFTKNKPKGTHFKIKYPLTN